MGRAAHVETVPSAAQSTIKMVCRLEENSGRCVVHSDYSCAYGYVSDSLLGNVFYTGKVVE